MTSGRIGLLFTISQEEGQMLTSPSTHLFLYIFYEENGKENCIIYTSVTLNPSLIIGSVETAVFSVIVANIKNFQPPAKMI